MKNRKRMLSLLEETANHYNSDNRSSGDRGICFYIPPCSKSEGCAIGRKLSEECKQFIIDNDLNTKSVAFLFSEFTRNNIEIPDSLKDLNINFLIELQRFHDEVGNWSRTGLSTYGKAIFQEIKSMIETGSFD